MTLTKLFTAFLLAMLTLIGISASLAEELVFRQHNINADSTYSACAAFDVDHDGELDIVCGGFWYEAPTWKRHLLRDVESIRGRFDGYSHLPLDVNGDGWMDFIECNYRSSTIYWIEHPGKSLGAWKKNVVDMPGPMETGRLIDIDGDGRLDILPNGVRSAFWYETWLEKTDDGKQSVRWTRHDLPKEVAGHGIGFGDINGDGRGDIVGPLGWLEAPQDRRKDRWIWHDEFELDRDCGIPILVFDVDGDGDNDLLWGRGHNIGLYWMEQTKSQGKSQRTWVRHAIDTSWSQPHSLLLADLDNDDKPEVIAGKRYMGHDGKDPGEYDPLVSYAYSYQPKDKTWKRKLISYGRKVGFGLDPKAVDLDADGDLDLVVSGRSGLFWLENSLGEKDQPAASSSQPPVYKDHGKLLVYQDASQKLQAVESPFDWAQRRAHVLQNMQVVMGSLPPPEHRPPLDVRIEKQEKTADYMRMKITFANGLGDRVPAYVLMQLSAETKFPGMLCLHQTTGIGKGEPAGLGGRKTLHYAHELAKRGYVCIVPDYPSFGDFQYDFKSGDHELPSGSMLAIWNNIRAVDVLESLNVHRDRIGVIGHSLGGHNALFTAAFEQRIKAVVTSCGFTAFHHYYGGKLAGWTSDRYMPRIRDVYKNDPDQVPFDFYEVLAAIAPRGIFVNAPQHDSNFELNGVKKVVAGAGEVYELLNAKDKLHAEYPDSGHDFPDDIRKQAYEWLDRQLK